MLQAMQTVATILISNNIYDLSVRTENCPQGTYVQDKPAVVR